MGTLHFEGLSREGGGDHGSVFEDIESRFLQTSTFVTYLIIMFSHFQYDPP